MLKKLELINFQIHKHLVIDFSENITTIIGPSDEGKSAIKRALEWVCLNQPAGNDFMNWDKGINNVSVALTTEIGIVTRSWEKGENLYTLNIPGEPLKEYKAFGRSVPESIEQFLQISEINFQDQHDQPFWFCNTPGEVSRNLNKIVSLDLIDTVLSKLDSLKRTEESLFRDRTERLDNAKNDYTKLHYVNVLQTDLKTLKQTAAISLSYKSKYDKLYTSLNEALKISEKLKQLKQIVLGNQSILKQGAEYKLLKNKITILEMNIINVDQASVLVNKPIPDITGIKKQIEINETIKIKTTALLEILLTIDGIINRANEDKKEMNNYKQELQTLTKGLCPICKTPIKS